MVPLDLKTASGLAHAWELLQSADVVVENFSTGVMARLGLSAEAVRAVNPRCIYLSMPGFASDDELHAEVCVRSVQCMCSTCAIVCEVCVCVCV